MHTIHTESHHGRPAHFGSPCTPDPGTPYPTLWSPTPHTLDTSHPTLDPHQPSAPALHHYCSPQVTPHSPRTTLNTRATWTRSTCLNACSTSQCESCSDRQKPCGGGVVMIHTIGLDRHVAAHSRKETLGPEPPVATPDNAHNTCSPHTHAHHTLHIISLCPPNPSLPSLPRLFSLSLSLSLSLSPSSPRNLASVGSTGSNGVYG